MAISNPGAVPIMPSPEGDPPGFDETSPLQTTLVIVYSVTFAIATLLLTLRMYTSAYLVRRFGFDECLVGPKYLYPNSKTTWSLTSFIVLIVLAWIGSAVLFTLICLAMKAGFGKHIWDVSEEQFQAYPPKILGIALTYFWLPTLTKLALLVLYHRINPSSIFRACVYTMASSLVVYTLAFMVLLIGPCNPLATSNEICLNNVALAQATLNILTDAILIVMPVPTIFSLGMPLRQRLNVFAILALGSGAMIASIVRITYIKSMQTSPDVTWTQAAAAVWSFVEVNIGITCNSMALMKPFVRRHLPWLVGRGSERGADTIDFVASHSIGGRPFQPWRGDRAVGLSRIYSTGLRSVVLPETHGIQVEHQHQVEVRDNQGSISDHQPETILETI